MKSLRIILAITLLSSILQLAYSQQDINPKLYKSQWLDNETQSMYGYDITKIFGQHPDNMATYNFSPITSVAYKSLDTIISNFEDISKVAKWSEETLKTNIQDAKDQAKGGEIMMYITRYKEENANTKYYLIVIRDINDKTKLWEYTLPYKAPQNPVNNGWWNYIEVAVPVELPDNFYIYIDDKLTQNLDDFKFMVNKQK
jgi:hypothetical protein